MTYITKGGNIVEGSTYRQIVEAMADKDYSLPSTVGEFRRRLVARAALPAVTSYLPSPVFVKYLVTRRILFPVVRLFIVDAQLYEFLRYGPVQAEADGQVSFPLEGLVNVKVLWAPKKYVARVIPGPFMTVRLADGREGRLVEAALE